MDNKGEEGRGGREGEVGEWEGGEVGEWEGGEVRGGRTERR